MTKEIYCERSNYIPHNTNYNVDREEWHNEYIDHIYNIHLIIKSEVEKEFPKKANWNNKHLFNNLSRTLYHCSSKHIYKFDD